MANAQSSMYNDTTYRRAQSRLLRTLKRSGRAWLQVGDLALAPGLAARALANAAECLLAEIVSALCGETAPTMGRGMRALERMADELRDEDRKSTRRLSPYLWYLTSIRNLLAHEGDTVSRDDVVELMRKLEVVFAWFFDRFPEQADTGFIHVSMPSVESFRDDSGHWHVLPRSVAGLAKKLRDAYRAGDFPALERCFTSDYRGDLYGAATRAELIQQIRGFHDAAPGRWELDVRVGTCVADSRGQLTWKIVFEVREGARIVEDRVTYVSVVDLEKPVARIQSLRSATALRGALLK